MPTVIKKPASSTTPAGHKVEDVGGGVVKVTPKETPQGKALQPKMVVLKEHTKDKGKTVISSETEEKPAGEPVAVPHQMAVVGFEAARVWTDGNYGSYRVGVSLSIPCEAEYGEIKNGYEAAKAFVNAELVECLKGTPADPKG
jgi:hypothetical protein